MSHDSESPQTVKNLRDRVKLLTSGTILDAAEGVFAEQGVQGARMEDIAARAGVAVGTLYNYFSDRQTLIAALHSQRKEQLLDLFDRSLMTEGELPFEETLRRVIRAQLEFFDTHRAYFILLNQGGMGAERAEALCSMRDTMGEMFDRFDRLMASGVATGVLRPEGAPLYAPAVFGLFRGVFIRQQMTGTVTSVADRTDAVIHLFLDGARARCTGVGHDALPSSPKATS